MPRPILKPSSRPRLQLTEHETAATAAVLALAWTWHMRCMHARICGTAPTSRACSHQSCVASALYLSACSDEAACSRAEGKTRMRRALLSSRSVCGVAPSWSGTQLQQRIEADISRALFSACACVLKAALEQRPAEHRGRDLSRALLLLVLVRSRQWRCGTQQSIEEAISAMRCFCVCFCFCLCARGSGGAA